MQQALAKIHFLLLNGLVISMTFSFDSFRLTGVLAILMAINAIPLYYLTRNNMVRANKGLIMLFVSVYIIHIIGLVRMDNFVSGTFELEKKLSMLTFPLVLFFTPRLESKKVNSVLLMFAGSCVLVLLFCLSVATYRFIVWNTSSFFFYHNLSEIVGMHAAYFSMYLCFSIAILLTLGEDEIKFFGQRKATLFKALALILVVGLFLLASRAQILILVICGVAYAEIQLSKRYGHVKSTVLATAAGLITLSIALAFPLNRERFKQAINYNNQYSLTSEWGDQQIRVLIWSCAFELIKANPLSGVGLGDGQDALQECYIRNEYVSLTYFSNMRFNAHNQYLETAIELGFVGVLILVASHLIPFVHAIRERKILYGIFIVIFSVSCMTESMLERQSGIMFFAFFNSFLLLNAVLKRNSI